MQYDNIIIIIIINIIWAVVVPEFSSVLPYARQCVSGICNTMLELKTVSA